MSSPFSFFLVRTNWVSFQSDSKMMPCKLNNHLICLDPEPMSKSLATNLRLLTNKNAQFHWTLLLGPLSKVTLRFWTQPPPDITPGTNTYNQWRPKIPKTRPQLQPSIGTSHKCQRTKKNQWIFQGCKIPRNSGSLILIFSKIPRTDLFFYFDISKNLELVVLWNKMKPPNTGTKIIQPVKDGYLLLSIPAGFGVFVFKILTSLVLVSELF